MPIATPSAENRRSGYVIAALFISIGVAGLLISIRVLYSDVRGYDFLSFYSAATMAREGRFDAIHDVPEMRAQQQRIVPGSGRIGLYNRPLAYAAVIAPISLLGYDAAFAVWLAAQGIVLLGCWVWAVRRFGFEAAVFGTLYPPAVLGIAHGQDCMLPLLAAICAYVMARRGKEWTSGAVLGLGLVKFHLFLLWPLALAFRRKWRMLGGFCATGAVIVAGSLVLGGWQGALRYLRLLKGGEAELLRDGAYWIVSSQGILANLGIDSPPLSVAVPLAVGALVLLGLRRASTDGLFAGAIGGSIAVAPHVYGYDATVLLLALWLTMFRSGWAPARAAARFMATPIPFFFLLFKPPVTGLAAACVLIYVMVQQRFGAPSSG